MPCQLCKSHAHTLAKCNSDIGNTVFEAVDAVMRSYQLQIVAQIGCLKERSSPELKFIAKRLHVKMTGTKTELICDILYKYFDSVASLNHYPSLTDDNLERINVSYTQLYGYMFLDPQQMPFECTVVYKAYTMLNRFYLLRYGPERVGEPLEQYLGALYYTAANFPMRLSSYARRERLGVEAAEAIETIDMHRRRALRRDEALARAMLELRMLSGDRKLTFRIEVDASLNQAKECCICYEDKMSVKLGCSHETCVDCLYGIANARKKTNPVITCAMCRSDIDVVHVNSDAVKAELKQKIDAL